MTHTRIHKIWSKLLRADGQAFVEFAIVLPMLVLLLFGIVKIGAAFHSYLAIADAVRVGARAGAVATKDENPCEVAETAAKNTVSATQRSKISFDPNCTFGPDRGNPLTLSIKYDSIQIKLPGIDHTVVLTASATERMEIERP